MASQARMPGGQAMKTLFRLGAIAVLATMLGGVAIAAEKKSDVQKSRPPLGNNPHPVVSGGKTSKPNSSASQPSSAKPSGSADRRESGHSHCPSGFPSGGYVIGYEPYYYGYVYPYAYPPLYIPAEELYGPQAVRRFWGIDAQYPSNVGADISTVRMRRDDDTDQPEPKKTVERATNSQSNALARRFITFGDARFAQQNFADANMRYRKAAEVAPSLADPFFRQAFALSAIGRYEAAVAAVKRGLKLNPNWAQSDFNLKELYGDDVLAKDARLDALAAAAEAKPNDFNLLFLVGLHLHFDDQAPRAEKFFRLALQLAGDDAEYIRVFLEKEK